MLKQSVSPQIQSFVRESSLCEHTERVSLVRHERKSKKKDNGFLSLVPGEKHYTLIFEDDSLPDNHGACNVVKVSSVNEVMIYYGLLGASCEMYLSPEYFCNHKERVEELEKIKASPASGALDAADAEVVAALLRKLPLDIAGLLESPLAVKDEDVVPGIVDPEVIHKKNPANALLSEPFYAGRFVYYNMLRHTEEFRFDHESDHVQGMLILEAMRQAAGESHGPALSAIVEGLPAGVTISPEDINNELARRQQGYGRGGRMKIESDRAVVHSGIRFGKTIGSPVSLQIENRDWKNWTVKMAQFEKPDEDTPGITVPRPGHADLAGMIKYGFEDIRPVIERASARETAARVAACSLVKVFLRLAGIQIGSYVSSIGPAGKTSPDPHLQALLATGAETLAKAADSSCVRMLEKENEEHAVAAIDKAREEGDTLGGIIELFITGVPMGLGSYVQHDRRLDAELAAALISIQAVKGVEIGTAFENARKPGSQVHDELFPGKGDGPVRKTNRAGGLEGSMTNG